MKKCALIFVLFLTVVLFIVIYFTLNASDITVIVRSVGENSEEVCVKNLENIFSKRNVFLIKNITPLSSATKKSFELALKRNKKWTLLVDADTIVDGDKIKLFISKADEIIKNDPKAFVFQPLIYDKFPQNYRHSGVWLYRSDKLGILLNYYQKCALMLKPDDCFVTSFLDNGGNSYGIDCVVGVHDFFQSPKSIVKKYFLRNIKSRQRIKDWDNNWLELSKKDNDFYWAHKGVELSKNYKKEDVKNDAFVLDNVINGFNLSFPLDEKPSNEEVFKVLNKYVINNPIDKNEIKSYRTRLYKRDYI